jgi:hypothetical protein
MKFAYIGNQKFMILIDSITAGIIGLYKENNEKAKSDKTLTQVAHTEIA